MTKLHPLPYINVNASRNKTGPKERLRKRNPLPLEKVVVIGASAGGIDAICSVLKALPEDLPVAVLVVQHLLEGRRTHLPEIIGRTTPLHVLEAEDGMDLETGVVYVAAPGKHLLLQDRRIALGNGLPVRHVKPSVDVLFKSAAVALGASVISVILSGTGRDGAEGCRAVKAGGGITMAQDPGTASFCYMPEAAIKTGCVDYVLPLEGMGVKIRELTTSGVGY